MTAPPSVPAFCGIDTTDLALARRLAATVADQGFGIKLGKEFFAAHGPAGVRDVVPPGAPLFLDLKFHDIPNTVAGAVRAATQSMAPYCMTVHAAGGSAMVKAAVDAARAAPVPPLILAVTILTSLDATDLAAVGLHGPVIAAASRLAALAKLAGCDGLICASTEIAALRALVGTEMKLVVPGIRPAGSDVGDQKRVMTPAQAFTLGADYLVIGRPITAAPNPAMAATAIAAELRA